LLILTALPTFWLIYFFSVVLLYQLCEAQPNSTRLTSTPTQTPGFTLALTWTRGSGRQAALLLCLSLPSSSASSRNGDWGLEVGGSGLVDGDGDGFGGGGLQLGTGKWAAV